MGLPHIVKALYLLKKYPDYRFVLDQMCYVRPFLERYPAEVPAFPEIPARGPPSNRRRDGHDARQQHALRRHDVSIFGKWYFRDALGYDVTTGWGLDTFGHNAQMPQILKLAGMKSYWFERGVPTIDTPSEFAWERPRRYPNPGILAADRLRRNSQPFPQPGCFCRTGRESVQRAEQVFERAGTDSDGRRGCVGAQVSLRRRHRASMRSRERPSHSALRCRQILKPR